MDRGSQCFPVKKSKHTIRRMGTYGSSSQDDCRWAHCVGTMTGEQLVTPYGEA